MERNYREPEFYTIQMLYKKLGVTASRIDVDLITGVIKKFAFQNLYSRSKSATRKRIKQMMPMLNQYAREHLHENPSSLIFPKAATFPAISKSQQDMLANHMESDKIFELWIKEYNIDIDHIKLVIPRDEARSYEQHLSLTSDAIAIKDENSFDIVNYITNHRESTGCKRTSCLKCSDVKCRKDLSNDLASKMTLCKIGIAMGFAEPYKARDKDDSNERKKQKRAVDKIKSQVNRWRKAEDKTDESLCIPDQSDSDSAHDERLVTDKISELI